jgi:hypothetical protein
VPKIQNEKYHFRKARKKKIQNRRKLKRVVIKEELVALTGKMSKNPWNLK